MKSRKEKLANGLEQFWLEQGSGDPLLLLHGFPFSSDIWLDQLDYFSKAGWRVIAPDFRGFGQTTPVPSETNTVERLAEDTAALLDYLNIEKAVVMGLSMGGYVSFAFYRQFPERVRALILVDTKCEADNEEARQNRYKLREAVLREGSGAANATTPKLFAPETYKTKPEMVAQIAGLVERTDPATITATISGLAERPDSTPLLPQISVPTLVIHGKYDLLMPVENARGMAQKIPNWQFSSVPHAGHMANMENPEFFNRAVETFLKELKNS